MKKINVFMWALLAILSACSSKKKNNFDEVGKEEIKVNDGRVEIVNTKSLEQALKVERVKREASEKQALHWKEDYEKAKTELMQARVALGLPAERTPCNPCKPGQITPTSTIQEELDAQRRAKKKARRQEAKEDAEEESTPPALDSET